MLVAKSVAKINLFLNVVGKRDDGYHLLESLFLPLSLHDTIAVLPDDAISTNLQIPDNIVVKVAHKLKNTFGVKAGVRFIIEKNIPIAAGLGGGSSNAATALKLLCKMWRINLSKQEMMEFAVSIGADVPFFIDPAPAFVEGIGEVITPITISQKLYLLLVNPGLPVLTADIFRMGFFKFTPKLKTKSSEAIEKLIFSGKNDLENNATIIEPAIKQLLQEIKAQRGCLVSRMSGSGSTCFGIFDNITSLKKAEEHFKRGNFWTFIDKGL